jgi:hypothetical protein
MPDDQYVPPRNLPAGATLPSWLEQVAPYYLGRDYMVMMTRAEVNAQRSEPISDHDWDKLGAIGGSNVGHPFFRIKTS